MKEIKYVRSIMKSTTYGKVAIVNKRVQELEEMYSAILTDGPVRYHAVYHALVLQNQTQKQVAEQWEVTLSYVKKLHRQMCVYLTNQLNSKKGEKR